MRYEVLIDDSVKGPYTLDELGAQLTNGAIWPSTPARDVGQNDWRVTADVVEQPERLVPPRASRGHGDTPPIPNDDSLPIRRSQRGSSVVAGESVIDNVFRVWAWILGGSLLVGVAAVGFYFWHSVKDPDEQRLMQRLGRSALILLSAGAWKPFVLIPLALVAFWKTLAKWVKRFLGSDVNR
jgi:hypothetical protein